MLQHCFAKHGVVTAIQVLDVYNVREAHAAIAEIWFRDAGVVNGLPEPLAMRYRVSPRPAPIAPYSMYVNVSQVRSGTSTKTS